MKPTFASEGHHVAVPGRGHQHQDIDRDHQDSGDGDQDGDGDGQSVMMTTWAVRCGDVDEEVEDDEVDDDE